MSDDDLRSLLEALDPKARDALRRVLIHDQADRDTIASQLPRYRDDLGQRLGQRHRRTGETQRSVPMTMKSLEAG